ncbi:hypothetical protein AOLI_G00073860 [Acnodon oligacanthus]
MEREEEGASPLTRSSFSPSYRERTNRAGWIRPSDLRETVDELRLFAFQQRAEQNPRLPRRLASDRSRSDRLTVAPSTARELELCEPQISREALEARAC